MLQKRSCYSLVLSAATIALAAPALAQDKPPTYPLQGTVYVETNNYNPGQNAVLAFRRATNGTLTPLSGSPYTTGGTGITDPTFGLAIFASDKPVVSNSQHTLLFAVNEGSNTIAAFRIGAEGRLKAVPGSPFPSGGYQPVGLSIEGNVLVVANKNANAAEATAEQSAQPNYASFTIAGDGVLTPVANSTSTATASPSQAVALPASQYSAFSSLGYADGPAGSGYAFGADFAGGNLQSFLVSPTGALTQNTPLPLPANLFVGQTFQGGPAPAAPLGLAAHPLYPLLYVGFVTINQIGVYVFGPDAKLYFLDSVPNTAPTNCWILINSTGTRLYAVDTLTNQITTFDIGTNPLLPKELGVTQLSGAGRAFELALSTDGNYLYVISEQADATGSIADNALHVLQVGTGSNPLTEIQTQYLSNYVQAPPADVRWQGVVAF